MATSNDTTKTCTKCGKELPATAEYFYADNRVGRNGFKSQCITCHSEGTRVWREKNIDRERAKARVRAKEWASKNPDLVKQRSKEWRAKNEAHCREYRRKQRSINRIRDREQYRLWAANNRLHRREYMRLWYKNNPSYASSQNNKRRFRIRQSDSHYTQADVELQLKSQKGLCWWCGEPLDVKYHIDHRIPVNRGGSNSPNNIVIAHPECNMSKSNKMPWEWSDRLL
jgi:hypothetical protein